jgi:hypothetical protein
MVLNNLENPEVWYANSYPDLGQHRISLILSSKCAHESSLEPVKTVFWISTWFRFYRHFTKITFFENGRKICYRPKILLLCVYDVWTDAKSLVIVRVVFARCWTPRKALILPNTDLIMHASENNIIMHAKWAYVNRNAFQHENRYRFR